MVVYMTKVYNPQALLNRFGEKWVFSFFVGKTHELNVSSLLWFFICLIFSFILVAVLKKVYQARYAKKESI